MRLYILRKVLHSSLLLLLLTSACFPRNLPGISGLNTPLPRPSRTPFPTRTPVPTRTPQPTATTMPTQTPQPTPTPLELAFPIRAAFYQPGYALSWNQNGMDPFTHYHPGLGFYNLDDRAVIDQHIAAMLHGGIQAGIAGWPGPKQGSDARVPMLLEAGGQRGFAWALQPESERLSDPDVESIRADLAYIRVLYSGWPAYLRLGGRFVVFVDAGPEDGCPMVQRWQQASSMGAYVVMQTFPGYEGCAVQPDGWYPALPVNAETAQTAHSFIIRPGFWKADEGEPQLARDLLRWAAAVRAMAGSGSSFQLVSTFNRWDEGSAVEDAQEWPGSPGNGQYLDALHANGDLAVMFPYHLNLPHIQHDTYAVLLGAGDIAQCWQLEGAERTSALLASLLQRYPDAAIFTAGDNTQGNGEEDEYDRCFELTWGQFKDRIRPSPGNHDANANQLNSYYDYFGAAGGERGQGYYSYDLAGWHIIALNSNCDVAGGCLEGTPQEQWLKADLASHPARCTLAYWHHPMFNSGHHGSHGELIDLWRHLYNAGAELIINGHEHMYERFAPLDPLGNLDPQRGIRQFIAGTGGADFHNIVWEPEPNSELIIQNTQGVFKLELIQDRYRWEFVPVDEGAPTDAGTEMCR